MSLNFETYKKWVSDLRVGKQLPDAVYLHKSALSATSNVLQILVQNVSKALKIKPEHWNIIKFYKRDFKVAYLNYPDFDTYAYPALQQSITVDLQKLSHRKADYSKSDNPPILHRRETFVLDDYPLRTSFIERTLEGEAIGLYENTRNIGFKKNWERLVRSKGYMLDEEGALKQLGSEPEEEFVNFDGTIERHRTAIDRNQLSAPMQLLARYGYFDRDFTVLDYGCGKGDDLRELEAHGVDCIGWDPVYAPDTDLFNCDIVNLGFVLNVIEDKEERDDTLRRAYEYADKLLIASVMVAGESVIRQFKPYKDGVITKINTFQKYYSQAEFKYYLESTLNQDAIAVGQGIFIVFKDKLEEQRFLLERQHTRRDWQQKTIRQRKTSERKISKDIVEKHPELFNDFWELCLDLGRIPAVSEFEHSVQIRRIAGSHKKALDALIDYHGEETYKTARYIRKCDLLVYFALGLFGKRQAYTKMPDSLKRDIKAFFGDYNAAIELANEALFSVGNPEVIEQASEEAYKQLKTGEFEQGHHWTIHKNLLPLLPPELRIYVGCATQLYGDIDMFHLIKIHFTSGKVTLLRYDDWSKDKPILVERVKIKMREQDIDFFDYSNGLYEPQYIDKEIFTYA